MLCPEGEISSLGVSEMNSFQYRREFTHLEVNCAKQRKIFTPTRECFAQCFARN